MASLCRKVALSDSGVVFGNVTLFGTLGRIDKVDRRARTSAVRFKLNDALYKVRFQLYESGVIRIGFRFGFQLS